MPRGIYERTPEHNAAISAALMDHSVSEETRLKISKGKMGVPMSEVAKASMSRAKIGRTLSEEQKAAISRWQQENPQTGEDIVNHHYIYDDKGPSKYTMKVTKSKHRQIHCWMKKAGIKVSHINIKE